METKQKKSKIGKIILIVIAIIVLVFAVAGISHSCQRAENEKKSSDFHKDFVGVDDFKTIEWPDTKLANMLPSRSRISAGLTTNPSDHLSVYIGKTSEKDYRAIMSRAAWTAALMLTIIRPTE